MNYGQFVRFAEKNWHLGADKLTQITVQRYANEIDQDNESLESSGQHLAEVLQK